MKVKVLGAGSFYGPHKVMMSVGPNTVLDVDDTDRVAVEFWQARVDGGAAELLDAPAKTAAAATPSSDDLDIEEGGEPPRSGPGSGKAAWAAYAETAGVDVADDMTRDDIIAAVDES